ncbi:MAG: hypothetical protein ACQESF_01850, partial [Nanobdellota archaeon]
MKKLCILTLLIFTLVIQVCTGSTNFENYDSNNPYYDSTIADKAESIKDKVPNEATLKITVLRGITGASQVEENAGEVLSDEDDIQAAFEIVERAKELVNQQPGEFNLKIENNNIMIASEVYTDNPSDGGLEDQAGLNENLDEDDNEEEEEEQIEQENQNEINENLDED